MTFWDEMLGPSSKCIAAPNQNSAEEEKGTEKWRKIKVVDMFKTKRKECKGLQGQILERFGSCVLNAPHKLL